MAKSATLPTESVDSIYHAAQQLCRTANECQRAWHKFQLVPAAKRTLGDGGKLANQYALKAGELLVSAINHGAFKDAEIVQSELKAERKRMAESELSERHSLDRLHNRVFLFVCEYWLTDELLTHKLIDERKQKLVHASNKPEALGLYYAEAMRWLAVLMVPCTECGAMLSAEDIVIQRSICSKCRSPRGKVADLDIALRASGDHPSRIKQWQDIKYLANQRWAGLDLEKKSDSDWELETRNQTELAERIKAWLRIDCGIEPDKVLAVPLDELVRLLNSKEAEQITGANGKGKRTNQGTDTPLTAAQKRNDKWLREFTDGDYGNNKRIFADSMKSPEGSTREQWRDTVRKGLNEAETREKEKRKKKSKL